MEQTTANAVAYKADVAHSYVGFKVRHMGFSKVKGKFNDFDVTVTVDPKDITTLSAEAAIKTATVDTGNADRDKHLRSGDFFESEEFPTMEFKGSEVRNVKGNDFELAGELTIRGVTKPVVLKGEFNGEAKDPWGNDRVAFEGEVTINRKEFGLTWNQVLETGGLLVSEDVDVIIDLQAVKSGE